jgi:group I intron endonuclease
MENDIWEEKSLTNQEVSFSKNNEFVPNDITRDIKIDSTPMPCEGIGIKEKEINCGIIYKATCSVNGKSYVGVTYRPLIERIHEHVKSSRGNPKYLLHRSIKKYGTDKFKFDVIDTYSSLEERDKKEILFVKQLKTYFKCGGYNMTLGGDGSRGHVKSQEAIDKIKVARSKQIFSKETKKLWSKNRTGRKHSEETKKKMSKSMTESGCHRKTEEHKHKLRIANLGKRRSEESKKLQSEKTVGKINRKFVSQEHLDLIRELYKRMGINKLTKELKSLGIPLGRKVVIRRLMDIGIYNENFKFRINKCV